MKQNLALLVCCFLVFETGVFANCDKLNDKSLFKKHPSKIIHQILRNAGNKVLSLRENSNLSIEKKSNFADLKTKGDCASQSSVFNELNKVYPLHKLLGEEKCLDSTAKEKSTKKVDNIIWILDPIDGTTNYAHGLNHFNISLALVVDGEICYGAVYAPVFKEYFYAEKGKGAFLDYNGHKKRLSVSKIKSFSESLWVTGFKTGHKEKVDANIPIMREVLLKTHGIIRPGSAALDLAYVAAGRTEGYWELFMDWWDVAAGLLLVEEAGGKSFVMYPAGQQGKTVDYEKPTLAVMASNGSAGVHNEMIKIIRDKIKE